MAEVTCSLDHPVFFRFDYENRDVKVPEISESAFCSSNEKAITVKANSYIDGDVNISFSKEPRSGDFAKIFDGRILCPNRKIAVIDSNDEKLLEVDTSSACVNIIIEVDDIKHPSAVNIICQG